MQKIANIHQLIKATVKAALPDCPGCAERRQKINAFVRSVVNKEGNNERTDQRRQQRTVVR